MHGDSWSRRGFSDIHERGAESSKVTFFGAVFWGTDLPSVYGRFCQVLPKITQIQKMHRAVVFPWLKVLAMRVLGAAAGPRKPNPFFSLPDARPPCRGWEAYAFMPTGMEVTRSLAPSLISALLVGILVQLLWVEIVISDRKHWFSVHSGCFG